MRNQINHGRPGKIQAEQNTRAYSSNPNKALLVALIERSILDLRNIDRNVKKSAEQWFFLQDKPPFYPFSFSWALQHLNMFHLKEEILRKLKNPQNIIIFNRKKMEAPLGVFSSFKEGL